MSHLPPPPYTWLDPGPLSGDNVKKSIFHTFSPPSRPAISLSPLEKSLHLLAFPDAKSNGLSICCRFPSPPSLSSILPSLNCDESPQRQTPKQLLSSRRTRKESGHVTKLHTLNRKPFLPLSLPLIAGPPDTLQSPPLLLSRGASSQYIILMCL